MIKNFTKKINSGFVMLFAVVISGVILAITIGVTNIALLELNFETSSKETNAAFMAADVGVECALFHDLTGGDSAFGVPFDGSTTCAGVAVDLNNGFGTPDASGLYSFPIYPLGESGDACAVVTVDKTDTEVTEVVSRGYNLGGGGDCTASGSRVVERELYVVLNNAAEPTFGPYTVSVAALGGGGTAVISAPGETGDGIDCPGDCTDVYNEDYSLTLTVTENSETFTGWTGDATCAEGSSSLACTFDVTGNISMTANFENPDLGLVVSRVSGGLGEITAVGGTSGSSLNCSSASCFEWFELGEVVTMTATPGGTDIFSGWSCTNDPDCGTYDYGTCTGSTTPCSFNMSTPMSITATFDAPATPTYAFDVSTSGDGTGDVVSSDNNINCPGSCSYNYEEGTVLEIAASPSGGSTFVSWNISGASCKYGPADPTCVFTMPANTVTLDAEFSAALILYDVSVGFSGASTGAGTVTSGDGSIGCPGDCSDSYSDGTEVVLTANPDGSSAFYRWYNITCDEGSFSPICTFNVESNLTNILARFTEVDPVLTITEDETNGTGTLYVSPPNSSCSGSCQFTYNSGDTVSMSVAISPNNSGTVVSWSSNTGCSDGTTCSFVISQNMDVTVTYDFSPRINMFINNSNYGWVSATGGIACGFRASTNETYTDCTATYDYDTTVYISAYPNPGHTFSSWTGMSCGGDFCYFHIISNKDITANFQ